MELYEQKLILKYIFVNFNIKVIKESDISG